MNSYVKTITSISIHLKDENPIFGSSSTHVSLDDDAGGAFLIIRQCNDVSQNGEIRLEFEELPLILEAANQLRNQLAVGGG